MAVGSPSATASAMPDDRICHAPKALGRPEADARETERHFANLARRMTLRPPTGGLLVGPRRAAGRLLRRSRYRLRLAAAADGRRRRGCGDVRGAARRRRRRGRCGSLGRRGRRRRAERRISRRRRRRRRRRRAGGAATAAVFGRRRGGPRADGGRGRAVVHGQLWRGVPPRAGIPTAARRRRGRRRRERRGVWEGGRVRMGGGVFGGGRVGAGLRLPPRVPAGAQGWVRARRTH
jgi:hypothetical protein